MVKELPIPFLGPRPNTATEYFKRAYPKDDADPQASDLLQSIRRVIRPPNSCQVRQTLLYPSQESSLDEAPFHDVELSWNSCCVLLSAGAVIYRKWTLEEEDQDIQWACKGLLELTAGITDGLNPSFSSISSEEVEASSSNSSAFSRFAESTKARQRAITPPKRVPAIYVFLRSLGRIFTETGEEYTFNLPFLVRRAWPLRPHGVLIQREISEFEEKESARTGEPLLPTLFSLHDPFAELKVVGLAERIHGALGPTNLPTTITQLDPDNLPEAKTPDDYASSSGYKSASQSAQGNPPTPPVPKQPLPLTHPPATDRVIWTSEEITIGTAMENILVTSTEPTPSPQSSTLPEEITDAPGLPRSRPKPHKYAHQVHLSIWRYAYLKPREIPDIVYKKKHQRNNQDRAMGESRVPNPSATSTPHHDDPGVIRRREWQDRADRIHPSSLGAAPPAGFPPPPSTIPFPLPKQPISVQPTLASLPGGELPSSWSHPFHGQPPRFPGHERQGSQDQLRAPTGAPQQSPETHMEIIENDDDIVTRMDAGHKKIRPSVWLERISVIPIPDKE